MRDNIETQFHIPHWSSFGLAEQDPNAEILDLSKPKGKGLYKKSGEPKKLNKTQQKRLNKFIERKLKQEHRAILFEKLA